MFTTQSSAYTFRQLVATGPNVAAGSSLDHTADRSLCNAGANCFQSLSVASCTPKLCMQLLPAPHADTRQDLGTQ
jgi:hypothetical protein